MPKKTNKKQSINTKINDDCKNILITLRRIKTFSAKLVHAFDDVISTEYLVFLKINIEFIKKSILTFDWKYLLINLQTYLEIANKEAWNNPKTLNGFIDLYNDCFLILSTMQNQKHVISEILIDSNANNEIKKFDKKTKHFFNSALSILGLSYDQIITFLITKYKDVLLIQNTLFHNMIIENITKKEIDINKLN